MLSVFTLLVLYGMWMPVKWPLKCTRFIVDRCAVEGPIMFSFPLHMLSNLIKLVNSMKHLICGKVTEEYMPKYVLNFLLCRLLKLF